MRFWRCRSKAYGHLGGNIRCVLPKWHVGRYHFNGPRWWVA